MEKNALAVSVHLKKTNQIIKIIEHIRDALVKLVHRLMSEWKIIR